MISSARHVVIALLCALALLAFSACGGVSPSSPPSPVLPQSSGIRGVTMFDGGPAPGTAHPDPGQDVAVHLGGLHGKIVTTVKADSSGAFQVDLPPGAYTLIETSSNAAQPLSVTVAPGTYTTVELWIHAM